jgi:hypothetical protein
VETRWVYLKLVRERKEIVPSSSSFSFSLPTCSFFSCLWDYAELFEEGFFEFERG